MAKRFKMGAAASRRTFTRHATKHHRLNGLPANPMRGGIRL